MSLATATVSKDGAAGELVFLIADDTAAGLASALEAAGFNVRRLSASALELEAIEAQKPSLILMTSAIPAGTRFDLCRGIRKLDRLADTSIVMLGKGTEGECIGALEAGADDYLSEPCSLRELVARIKAVLRRHDLAFAGDILTAGPLSLDTAAMKLAVAGKPVAVSITEFRLLTLFMQHPGRVFSRERILQEIWHDSRNVGKRAVDVYIRRLREKIGDAGSQLQTIRGAGYLFHAA